MSENNQLVNRIYDRTVRRILPEKIGMYNSVAVRRPKLFDRTDRYPRYEKPLIDAIRHTVKAHDHVVVVGGGFGVSTVVASRGCREVDVYEGGGVFETLAETIEMNFTLATVRTHHTIVGPAIEIHGDEAENQISPASLPDCDVLILDCEGAELDILREMETDPRDIIVECHGKLGSPEEDVKNELDRLGYGVVNTELECEEMDAYVLTANRIERK